MMQSFSGEDDYPTIAEIQELVSESRPDLACCVEDDIMRIHRDCLSPSASVTEVIT